MAEADCSSGGNTTRQKLFILTSSLFILKKADRRCLGDCLDDLLLAHFMTRQSLGVTHLPGPGDVSAKGKVTLIVWHRL